METLPAERQYWEERWRKGQTGWDLGQVSPPLKAYLSQLTRRDLSILIPGCGNAWEASYLAEAGYSDVTLLDIAPTAVASLRERFGEKVKVHLGDFFRHEEKHDLMLEQTFFCALPLEQRPVYVRQVHKLLKSGGKLAGVLFNRNFDGAGPPYGGDMAEYRELFEPLFEILVMDPCYNSEAPRQGTEVFILFRKKQTNPSDEN
jgi:SAM-dependent methyltransferase